MGVFFAARVSRFGVCAAESFAFARRMSFFLSKGRTFESYSQKVKLPRVNVKKKKREMEGKGRGTESRDIIEA